MRRYAEGTTVPVEKSRSEIERLLTKHGASSFMSAWTEDRYLVMFELKGRRCRFDVPPPSPKDYRTDKQWEAEHRRRWRALLLVLKAKLELIASGDADFDAEFLAYMVLPDGRTTMAQRLLPALDEALSGGDMPPLLPA